jgi:alanine dehydrogenase
MMIGVPKEIKTEEFRVGITPFGVQDLKREGHSILIETNAGVGSGFSNEEYVKAGAEIVDKNKLFESADLVLKVKEPSHRRYDLLRRTGPLRLSPPAPNRELTEVLLRKR